MHKVELAAALSQEGFNCAQAVIGAYGPELGLSRDLAMGVAAGFGGGRLKTASTAGAGSCSCSGSHSSNQWNTGSKLKAFWPIAISRWLIQTPLSRISSA